MKSGKGIAAVLQTIFTGFRPLLGAAAIAVVSSGAPVSAQSLEFGLTGDVKDGEFGASVAYNTAPVFTAESGLSGNWGAAARFDSGENGWVGAGFVLNYPFGENFFVEGSFMPGYYHEGNRELGGNLHFRSLIGVGWTVSPTGSVVLSLDHISNGGLDNPNPGTETVTLGYRMAF